MKKLRISALVLTAILAFTGCSSSEGSDGSSKKKSSSSSSASSSESEAEDITESETTTKKKSTATTTTTTAKKSEPTTEATDEPHDIKVYATNNFTYLLYNDYTEVSADGSAAIYDAKDENSSIIIFDSSNSSMTAKACAENEARIYEKEGTVTKLEKLEDTMYDCWYLDFEKYPESLKSQKNYDKLHVYYLVSDTSELTIYVMAKSGYEEEANEYGELLAQSVIFSGETYINDAPAVAESDFAKVKYDPKWVCTSDKQDELFRGYEIDLKYAAVDDPAKALTAFSVSGYYDSGYDSIAKLAEEKYEKFAENAKSVGIEVHFDDGEIFGCPAKIISYEAATDEYPGITYVRQYYFENSGEQYMAAIIVPKGDAEVENDIKQLVLNTQLSISADSLASHRSQALNK